MARGEEVKTDSRVVVLVNVLLQLVKLFHLKKQVHSIWLARVFELEGDDRVHEVLQGVSLDDLLELHDRRSGPFGSRLRGGGGGVGHLGVGLVRLLGEGVPGPRDLAHQAPGVLLTPGVEVDQLVFRGEVPSSVRGALKPELEALASLLPRVAVGHRDHGEDVREHSQALVRERHLLGNRLRFLLLQVTVLETSVVPSEKFEGFRDRRDGLRGHPHLLSELLYRLATLLLRRQRGGLELRLADRRGHEAVQVELELQILLGEGRLLVFLLLRVLLLSLGILRVRRRLLRVSRRHPASGPPQTTLRTALSFVCHSSVSRSRDPPINPRARVISRDSGARSEPPKTGKGVQESAGSAREVGR